MNELKIKGKNKCVIFFDFSNAYNIIDRQKLKKNMIDFKSNEKKNHS